MTSPDLLIYGATGYTGRLIVQRALARGLKPIIAGRDQNAVSSMAATHGLEWKAARVDQPERLRAMAESAAVLLNAAGPFANTTIPLIEACIAAGTHYLDVTGEADAIDTTMQWDAAATRHRVMLMPGVAFNIVASDCLAVHVARRLRGATTLKLGFDKSQPASRGSLKTSLEMSGQGVLIRRDGQLVRVPPGSLAHPFDYGNGPQISLLVSLGDVSSAFFSTGIGNIETYLRATLPVCGAIAMDQYWGWLLATPPWQAFLRAQIDHFIPDPPPHARRAGWATVVAEAEDGSGCRVRSRMHTGDAYRYSALTAVAIIERTLAGELKSGFQTPSRVYGPDFAMSFEGVRREDL